MHDTIQSLNKQLAEAEENLRLIQERKAKYVLETDIPLQIIKEEQRLEAQIADLQARLTQVDLPWYALLLFNVAIVVAIVVFLIRDRLLVSCVHPVASAVSEAVILLLFLHLVWRFLNPAIGGLADAIAVQGVKVPIKALASLLGALQPSTLSNKMLWLSFIVFSLIGVWILDVSPLPSPFLQPDETPIIQSFSVRYLDGTTVTLKHGDVVDIMPNEQVRVEAETLLHTDLPCTWSTARGTLQSAERCSTLYSAPFEGAHDTLVVLIQSACEKRQTYAGLHISIVQARSSP